jgi:hypothetical protein
MVRAKADLPLPPNAAALAQGTTVNLGATALNVDSYVTPMEIQALIEFYQTALPNAGWRVEPLPWQEQQERASQRLQKAIKEHRQAPEADQLKQLSQEFERTSRDLQRQIYATRGAEHMIVNLWPVEKGTMVFLNRWIGDRTVITGPSVPNGGNAAPSAEDAERWLRGENICCSGQEVPGLSGGSLPLSVPRYPNAKAVAGSTPAGDGRATVILKTADSAEAVAAYYRTQMPATGWKLLNDKAKAGEDAETSVTLVFQKPDRLCLLTIHGASASAQAPSQTLITVSTELRASLEGNRP